MEFNKLVSLVLGFIVLILVFVWISNRVRSSQTVSNTPSITVTTSVSPTPTATEEEEGTTWNPFAFLFNRDGTPTPTITPKAGTVEKISGMPTATPVEIRVVENGATGSQTTKGGITYTNNHTGNVQQIPETGAATLLLPLSLAAMTAGIYLKKRS